MKGKKLLAGALSAAMVLSTMAIPVFADTVDYDVSDAVSFNQAITDAQNNENTTIDLGGNTIEMTQYVETYKDIKFQNGTIDVSNLTDSTGHNAIIMGYACDLEFYEVDFKGTDYSSAAGVICVNTSDAGISGSMTVENCEFTLTNDSSKNGVLSGHLGNEIVKVKNCTFTLTNTGRVFKLMNLEMSDSTVTATTDSEHSDNAFRNVTGKMTNCTVSATGSFENGIKNTNGKELELAGTTSVELDNAIIANDGSTIKIAETASLSTTGTDNRVAKIGDTYYGSFESALAAAQTGETITLIADAEINNVPNAKITNAATINLNGKTLTFNKNGAQFGGITFVGGDNDTRGKIVATANASGGQGAIYCPWGGTVTLKNIDVDAKALEGNYFMDTQSYEGGSHIVLDNTKIDATADTSRDLSAIICLNGTNTSLTMKNESEIKASNIGRVINSTGDVTITNSTVDANNVKDAIFSHSGKVEINGNSTINATSVRGDSYNPTAAGIVLGATTTYTKADTATVNTSIYRAPSASNIADDEIKLSFEDVTVNAGEKVYDLYVEAASDKTINRLTTADLTFALTNDADNITPISYEVFGTDKVTVQPDNADSNKYLFYFNGLTAPSGTGVKVKVGQVKFNGYGKFSFKATAGEAHATTIDGENVVTDFVAGTQLAGQGKLNISTELTDVEITVPTKELTINIDFPNAVTDNAKEYQDMKVTVVGGTENRTFNLGTDDVAMADGKYVITTNLPENTPYTVEVSGAGYRTARYTVTMNADKTLNFWNNVKDNATVVETGNEAIKKNVTFLAGELVNDGKINIYDLSAVVSYFGATNLVEEHPEYAKYDLNRDGKVDSKDVAYVLVSWGK